MLRRSRISVRPNVSVAGRTGALTTPQDAPPQNQGASDIPAEGNEEHTATAETKEPTRRKRFSVKPKVAPRTWTSVRTPKSSVKAASEAQAPGPDPDKPTTSSQKETTVAQELQSQGRQKPSGESRQPKMQPTLSSPPPPSPTAVSPAEDTAEEAPLPSDKGKKSESSQARDVPPKPPDKIPPSLPEKEALEISERAETLVSRSSKSGSHLPAPRMSLSRLLNDPVDLQRLAKARKLRELLRHEMDKEKKDKALTFMESPERAQEPEILPETASQTMEDEEEVEAEEEKDQPLMAPRVKVAEDGSLIIDEESLTVEVQRSEGANPVEERDTVFERGTTTTYSSFRKGTYTKPWSSEETDMFFVAVSMVGTDFSMICQLFPHRARSEIKNKFKKEERENAWRIDKAFSKYLSRKPPHCLFSACIVFSLKL
uniref:Myb-like domain-containing protein n=1 Tax=Myripristis murdjan TaxID=586833 RepID=A0A667YTY9_9TELE